MGTLELEIPAGNGCPGMWQRFGRDYRSTCGREVSALSERGHCVRCDAFEVAGAQYVIVDGEAGVLTANLARLSQIVRMGLLGLGDVDVRQIWVSDGDGLLPVKWRGQGAMPMTVVIHLSGADDPQYGRVVDYVYVDGAGA